MFTLLLSTAIACFSETTPESEMQPQTQSPKASVVIYSGRGESMVGELFDKMEQKLDIKINVQYGSTAEMVTRLLTEGEQSPADIIFAQDSGHLGALSNKDSLEKLSPDLLAEVDPRFRDADGHWVGTSGRLRVLVYNSEQLKTQELPNTLKELADPKWKGKIGWAPGNGSFQAHVSALRHLWGEEETKQWLQGVQKNNPKRFPKNSPQVKAANDGSIQIGWVNHYYLHRLKSEGRVAQNFTFPTKDAGNLMMLSGVGIRKGTPNKKVAEQVIAYLVSVKGQSYFSVNNYEYPTRPNVPTNPAVPDLNIDHLLDVPQQHLADLGPTRSLLQELSLQ